MELVISRVEIWFPVEEMEGQTLKEERVTINDGFFKGGVRTF